MPSPKKSPAKKSAAKKPAAKSSPSTYTDPALRDRLKAKIQAGDKGGAAGQWSARKSQLLASRVQEGRRRVQDDAEEEGRAPEEPRRVDRPALEDRQRRARHPGRRDRPLPAREGLGRADPGAEEGDRHQEAGRVEGRRAVRRQYRRRQEGPEEVLIPLRADIRGDFGENRAELRPPDLPGAGDRPEALADDRHPPGDCRPRA